MSPFPNRYFGSSDDMLSTIYLLGSFDLAAITFLTRSLCKSSMTIDCLAVSGAEMGTFSEFRESDFNLLR